MGTFRGAAFFPAVLVSLYGFLAIPVIDIFHTNASNGDFSSGEYVILSKTA